MTPLAQLFEAAPRQFGYALRRVLWDTDDAAALLPDPDQYGWVDGGCLILAEALAIAMGDKVVIKAVSVSGRNYGDHFVVAADRWAIDATGVFLRATMCRRWAHEIIIGHCRASELGVFVGLDPFYPARVSEDIPRDAESSAAIAQYLTATLTARKPS